MSIWRVVPADWFALQDENACNNALRSIQENAAEVKSEKKKADRYEEELQREEKVLEGVRNSLKGMSIFLSSRSCALIGPADRTRVFRDWIEQKQKELQPWKMKIYQTQADVDVKTSEHDMLIEKAEAVKQANAEALEALETAESNQKAKVCLFSWSSHIVCSLTMP